MTAAGQLLRRAHLGLGPRRRPATKTAIPRPGSAQELFDEARRGGRPRRHSAPSSATRGDEVADVPAPAGQLRSGRRERRREHRRPAPQHDEHRRAQGRVRQPASSAPTSTTSTSTSPSASCCSRTRATSRRCAARRRAAPATRSPTPARTSPTATTTRASARSSKKHDRRRRECTIASITATTLTCADRHRDRLGRRRRLRRRRRPRRPLLRQGRHRAAPELSVDDSRRHRQRTLKGKVGFLEVEAGGNGGAEHVPTRQRLRRRQGGRHRSRCCGVDIKTPDDRSRSTTGAARRDDRERDRRRRPALPTSTPRTSRPSAT